METKFNFNSQICTSREQSERLLALGLKKETADMIYVDYGGGNYMIREYDWLPTSKVDMKKYIPAWSLHRLWELLPKSIWHDNGLEKKYHPIIEYDFVNYVTIDGMELFDLNYQKDVWKSMLDCIEWQIKEGYFNKEYLCDKEYECIGLPKDIEALEGFSIKDNKMLGNEHIYWK